MQCMRVPVFEKEEKKKRKECCSNVENGVCSVYCISKEGGVAAGV